eukprot:1814526-Prymnesium_polylepis.3
MKTEMHARTCMSLHVWQSACFAIGPWLPSWPPRALTSGANDAWRRAANGEVAPQAENGGPHARAAVDIGASMRGARGHPACSSCAVQNRRQQVEQGGVTARARYVRRDTMIQSS